jgi:hypothetical protein
MAGTMIVEVAEDVVAATVAGIVCWVKMVVEPEQ